MISTQRPFRHTAPGALLPRILAGVLVLVIIAQLQWFSSASMSVPSAVPTTINDESQKNWAKDTQESNQTGKRPSTPQYIADNPAVNHLNEPSTVAASKKVDYEKLFVSYGASKCLPTFNENMKYAAIERNITCAKYAPFTTEESQRVAFATITTGKPAEAYQRAIQSQMFASAVHGTSVHVLCEQLSDGAWNKIAFLLNLVMNEMLKPIEQRLQWIMWIDRDAIVLDPCRPLSSFLPPDTAEYQDVNLITNNDALGLNAGVFIFRVSDWATDLFNTILAYRYYRPDDELILAEQTAMEKIIHEHKWKNNVVRVPWYWFNAYPDEEDSIRKYKEGLESEDLEWFRARKGDYIVHFAGDDGRSSRMPEWQDMLQDLGNVYEQSQQQRDVTQDIRQYWSSWQTKSLTDYQRSGENWKEREKSR